MRTFAEYRLTTLSDARGEGKILSFLERRGQRGGRQFLCFFCSKTRVIPAEAGNHFKRKWMPDSPESFRDGHDG
jgi:hypothetical protein